MSSFLVITLGCKLNQLESEAIIDSFSQAGFEEAGIKKNKAESEKIPADIIINTCTVTSKADQKARRVIRKALRDYPDSRVIVTGCYAQLNKEDILKLQTGGKQRLFVVNKENIINLPQILIKGAEGGAHEAGGLFQFNPQRFSQHTRSFLKIQDGCDNHCTYCRIRLARGKSASLEADEVLRRLRILEKSHGEAVLTGVNISQYKSLRIFTSNHYRPAGSSVRQDEGGLAELLGYLINGTEKIAVRLSSLEPECIDENLAEALSHKRIRPHFHLSVQSGCKKILERMGRGYNAKVIEKAASLLRGIKDDPFLACDIIAGFPGETQADFEETFSLCQKIDFAWIHVFPYSKRPGTPAFAYKETIADSEAAARVRRFCELAKKGRADYVRRWIGREVDVLVEQSSEAVRERKGVFCKGISENYLKVLVRYEKDAPPLGAVLRCRLIEADEEMGGQIITRIRTNEEERGFDAQGIILTP